MFSFFFLRNSRNWRGDVMVLDGDDDDNEMWRLYFFSM